MEKVSIVIPVFNEIRTCREVFDRVYAKEIPGLQKEIIVVESNSTDGSREEVIAFGKRPGVKVVLQDKPQGKGFAVREGFRWATGDIVMIQDADLEYDFNDYEKVLSPIVEGKTNFVLGSRHLGAETWQIRAFKSWPGTTLTMNLAHKFFTGLFNVLFRQRTTDPATMFKVFKRDCLDGIEFQCSRFDFDFELVSRLVVNGHTPVEVPVSYNSRGFAAGKKVRFFRDPITWIRVLFMVRLQSLRPSTVALPLAAEEERPLPQND
jgi:glycosyltransferase involved in cell wall biosynthesis